ncbi:MAG: glycosyltransferase [Patescibacteria group bacterium]
MKTRKPKIAIFTHNYLNTSKERKDAGVFVYDYAQELAKHADVSIFCPDFGGTKEEYKKVPVTWFDWGGPKTKFATWSFFSPTSVYNFFKLLIVGCKEAEDFYKDNEVDYILSAWVIPSAFYALWLNIKYKVPYGVWILGSDVNMYAKLPILRQLTVLALRKATHRFANSYWLISVVENLSGKVCEYMDAITKFDDISKVKAQKLNEKVFNFLFVSRLEKVKGPDVLIAACKELKKNTNNFHLHSLGDGSMRKSLEEKVRQWGLEKQITFHGVASKQQVASFMKAADALVVASRHESIPLVMVEASRAGLATVTTDVGDCRIAIEKYDIGFVAKNEDPQDLAVAMNKAIQEGKNFNTNRAKGLQSLAKSRSQAKAVSILITEVDKVITVTDKRNGKNGNRKIQKEKK